MMINGEPTSISFVNGEPITRLARLLKNSLILKQDMIILILLFFL